MIERESRGPLLIGAVLAVILHAALVPVWGIGITHHLDTRRLGEAIEQEPLMAPQEVEVGRAQAGTTNIAWIAYDDFQELLARHDLIEQPALQRREQPVPDAPIELDPTPPLPDGVEEVLPGTQGQAEPDASAVPVPVSPTGPVPLPEPVPEGQMPYAPQGPMPSPTAAVIPDLPIEIQVPESPPTPTVADASGSPAAVTKPTSAPRDEAEAPPVTIVPGIIRVRPGAVLTADGIEIRTVVPRPSIIALVSTVPENPTAVLTFNREGRVTKVELIRSTGAVNWDEPVRTALEQWSASGERIEELEGELRVTVELLLRSRE